MDDNDLRRRYPREYAAWKDMIARCNDPTHPEYPNEGGRGITVADQWNPNVVGEVEAFESFLSYMGPMPR